MTAPGFGHVSRAGVVRPLLFLGVLAAVAWVVLTTCESCDTTARHLVRELYRAMF